MLEGTMRGERDRIIALAHQTEAMARRKVLKPLEHYLKRKDAADRPRGGRAVIEMAKRFKARQEKQGDGVQ